MSSNKENIKLHENLLKFFKEQNNLNILYNILNRKEVYSLRIIEWFITNYCKKHLVVYQVNGKPFNVYKKYKEVLKSFTKERFDPFKRIKNDSINIKILIYNPETKSDIETTICQMNFFK